MKLFFNKPNDSIPFVAFEDGDSNPLQCGPACLDDQLERHNQCVEDLTAEIKDWQKEPAQLKKEALVRGIAFTVATLALVAFTAFCIYGVIDTGTFLNGIGWMTPLNQLSPAAHGAAFAASGLMAFSICGAIGGGGFTYFVAVEGVQSVHQRWKHAVEKEATPKEKIEATLEEKRAKLAAVESIRCELAKLASEHLKTLEKHAQAYGRLSCSLRRSSGNAAFA